MAPVAKRGVRVEDVFLARFLRHVDGTERGKKLAVLTTGVIHYDAQPGGVVEQYFWLR